MNYIKSLLLSLIILFNFQSLATLMGQDLIGHWTFEPGAELVDLTGNFSDLVLNGAVIADGALDVGPNAWANTINYSGPIIEDKTLVSWVRMDDLNVRGGSVLTVDRTDIDIFDAIVYAEVETNRWMAGSNSLSRYQALVPGYAESTTGELVQMAICYRNNNGIASIEVYRNGILIGNYDRGPFASFGSGLTEVVFGQRHTFPNGALPGNPWVDAKIEEARVYSGCLTQEQIQNLGLTAIPTMGQWGLIILSIFSVIIGVIAIKKSAPTIISE